MSGPPQGPPTGPTAPPVSQTPPTRLGQTPPGGWPTEPEEEPE
jgi:hypothetical protein